jgi:hypothetical protein
VITFVKTRHHYDSYIDLFRLVELAGFPVIYVDELDVSREGVFITSPMNGEWRPHIDNQEGKPRNAHLILWNLERPSGSSGSVGNYGKSNRELIYKRYIDEVWVSDARLADETGAHFVVLGSHVGLGDPGTEKVYDLVHMSYETGRRQTIYKHFNKERIGPNCWPPERDDVLRKSRFALNVHQDHHPFQEPLRFALFAAWGLPILSETVFDGRPWASEQTIIWNGYDGIVGKLNQMLENDYERWRQMGQRARKMMTEEYEFGKMVRQAVDDRVNKWR